MTTATNSPIGAGEFEQLYGRFERQVYRFCLRLLGSSEDAADAAQDAFLNLLRRGPGLDAGDPRLEPYVMSAARNACFDVLRRRRRTVAVEPENGFDGEPPVIERQPAPAHEQPEARVLAAAQTPALRAALARLPERQRTALGLRDLLDLSYEEIGRRLDMNANAVAQLLHRARNAVRSELAAVPA